MQTREGRKDQDKTHEFIYVRHKDCNLVVLIVFPVRKVVPHLWGKTVGPGSFPLLRAIFGGHRNVHRQSQGSEHKQADVTPVVLFPWQLIKGIQQAEGSCSPLHLTYLGYCQAEFMIVIMGVPWNYTREFKGTNRKQLYTPY